MWADPFSNFTNIWVLSFLTAASLKVQSWCLVLICILITYKKSISFEHLHFFVNFLCMSFACYYIRIYFFLLIPNIYVNVFIRIKGCHIAICATNIFRVCGLSLNLFKIVDTHLSSCKIRTMTPFLPLWFLYWILCFERLSSHKDYVMIYQCLI